MPEDSNLFDRMCDCAVTRPNAEQAGRIANWKIGEADWATFVNLAEFHGVLPLAVRNLTQFANALPDDLRPLLQALSDGNLRRSLWFAAELIRILGYFRQEGIRVVPYKGPVLAQAAYGDTALRGFTDLDLLIAPADLDRAKLVLAKCGYWPSKEFSPAVERLFLRTGYEISFDCRDAKNLVELQWRLLPPLYAVDRRSGEFAVEDLLARAGTIELCGAQVPCLSPEDSLLAVCVHAAKHLWTRLLWVADTAEIVRAPGIDFATVAKRARALGVARIVGVSLGLAQKLLGCEVPAAARTLTSRDPEEAKLSDEFAQRLRQRAGYNFESTAYFRMIWNLRERNSDRWRYLWRLLWTPGPGDVAAVALPETLFPLYRVVRLGRLMPRLLGMNHRNQ